MEKLLTSMQFLDPYFDGPTGFRSAANVCVCTFWQRRFRFQGNLALDGSGNHARVLTMCVYRHRCANGLRREAAVHVCLLPTGPRLEACAVRRQQ